MLRSYSRLPITQSLATSNLALTRTKIDLDSPDFRHTLTAILPTVTRTLDNSNLPLTRSNFCFPSGHFLYNFTLDNSNHVCQYVTGQKLLSTVVQNILRQPCIVFLCITENGSIQFNFLKMSIDFLCPLKCSMHGTCIPSPSRVICSQLPVTRTPDNSNIFLFPLKVRVIGSQLYCYYCLIAIGGNIEVCQESICHDYVEQEYKPSSALNITTWITNHVIKKHQEKSFQQVSPPLSLLSCLFVRI